LHVSKRFWLSPAAGFHGASQNGLRPINLEEVVGVEQALSANKVGDNPKYNAEVGKPEDIERPIDIRQVGRPYGTGCAENPFHTGSLLVALGPQSVCQRHSGINQEDACPEWKCDQTKTAELSML
jgi:hypothetical protein